MGENTKIVKCYYAGDPDDEGCGTCDGITAMGDDGTKFPAYLCAGYKATEEEIVDAVDEGSVVEKENGSAAHIMKFSEPCTIEFADGEQRVAVGIESVTTDWPCGKAPSTGYTVKSIRAEYGVSVEVKGIWHKLNYTEERTLLPGCSPANEIFQLWGDVKKAIEDELEDIRNN